MLRAYCMLHVTGEDKSYWEKDRTWLTYLQTTEIWKPGPISGRLQVRERFSRNQQWFLTCKEDL